MSFVKRAILSFLAVVVLFTTSFFSVDLHFCEDTIQTASIYGNAEVCDKAKQQAAIENQLPPCCQKKAKKQRTGETTVAKKKCCYNETHEFKVDKQQHFENQYTASVEMPSEFNAFFPEVEASFFTIEANRNMVSRPPPDPFIATNLQSLYQVFVI